MTKAEPTIDFGGLWPCSIAWIEAGAELTFGGMDFSVDMVRSRSRLAGLCCVDEGCTASPTWHQLIKAFSQKMINVVCFVYTIQASNITPGTRLTDQG